MPPPLANGERYYHRKDLTFDRQAKAGWNSANVRKENIPRNGQSQRERDKTIVEITTSNPLQCDFTLKVWDFG